MKTNRPGDPAGAFCFKWGIANVEWGIRIQQIRHIPHSEFPIRKKVPKEGL
jgi:hypothetical protein